MKALVRALAASLGIGLALASCTPEPRHPPRAVTDVAAVAPLHAGTSGDYPPLSLWRDGAGRPEGFAPVLLESFGAAVKRPITWTRFSWTGLQADMQSGAFDVVADGITVRPERSIAGRFTVPIARGGAVLLLRRPAWAASATGVAELDRSSFRIAVNRGAHLERVTRSLFHRASIEAIGDNAAVRTALANGDVDAAMTNTFEAPRWAEGLAGVEPVGPLTHDVTALWVRDGQGPLAEQLDEWLLAEEASGHLGAVRRRLLGPGGGEPTAVPFEALLAAIRERLSLMPFVALAKGRGRGDVTDVVQEARVIAAAVSATNSEASKRHLPVPDNRQVLDFFRAQIEAAKDVQQATSPDARPPPFDLETQLRPAIARITARMAFLLVRLPRGGDRHEVIVRTGEAIADSGVSPEGAERLAAAVAALCSR